MKKVAAYCRVSTERQEVQQTILVQKSVIEEWASDNDALIVEWYLDDGWSGYILNRPELDRLRDDVGKGLWEAVVFVDRDRLARKLSFQELIIDELTEKQIEVILLNEALADNPEGRIMQQIKGVFAEYERAKITERMRRGKITKAKAGKMVGHNAPYGYRYVSKVGNDECHFVIYEPEAEVVRMIFGWVANEGYSIRKVVRELYTRGISPAKGQSDRWVKSVVERLLKRTDYYGVSYFNKSISVIPKNPLNKSEYKRVKKSSRREKAREEWYAIEVPAIIEKSLFDRVQERLQSNKVYNPRNKIYPYLLSGKVYCKCGHKRVGDGVNGHHYYRSAERIYTFPKPITGTCKCQGVNAEVLDNVVWNKIYSLMTQPGLLKPFMDDFNKYQLKTAKTKDALDRLRKALNTLDDEENRYVKAFGSKMIEFSTFQKFMKEVKDKKTLIKEQFNDLENVAIDQIANLGKDSIRVDDVVFSLKYSDTTEKQEIMRKLVASVIVGERSTALVKGVIPVVADAQNIQDVLKSRNSWFAECGEVHAF